MALSLLASRLERPLVLVDIGARWGVALAWDAFGAAARVLCFEPDVAECARLALSSPPNVTFLPFALAEADGEMTLTVTEEPACSSRYAPRRMLYERFPGLFCTRPERAVTVPARRLDGVLREQGVAPDLVKIDTQGSELDVLRGAEAALASCSALDVEVEFNPIYDGQPLFGEVDRFLRERGFVLWRFTEVMHYGVEDRGLAPAVLMHAVPGRAVPAAPGDGQVFWGQAHYVRATLTPAIDAQPPAEPVVAAATVAALGHWDLALYLLGRAGEAGLAAELCEMVTPASPPPDTRREDELARRLAAAEGELGRLLASSSWRLTAPLRRLVGMLN